MSEELPLFPLGIVLFPGCRVPLHIFEERYRLMISECLENETEFGLICGTDDDFAPVGCAARVTDLVNRFADGRMNIIVEGTDRFRVIERHDDRPFISARIQRVPDEDEAPEETLVEETRNLYLEAMKLSIGWYRVPTGLDPGPGELSYTIASVLGMPVEQQQELLAETSVPQRFRRLREMLEGSLGRLREHARKVAGNGKAH